MQIIFELLSRHKKTVFILVSLLIILGGITYSFIGKYGMFSGLQNDLKAIDPPLEFAYTDLDGNQVSLEKYKGKPLIINSWASWMPFSQTELPLLIRIQEENKGNITVLAINRMEEPGMIRAFLSAYSIPESIVFLIDPSDNFYAVIGGYAMPETVVYDSDGVMMLHKRGVLTEEELRTVVKDLIQ